VPRCHTPLVAFVWRLLLVSLVPRVKSIIKKVKHCRKHGAKCGAYDTSPL
jgi:hypothetical protein